VRREGSSDVPGRGKQGCGGKRSMPEGSKAETVKEVRNKKKGIRRRIKTTSCLGGPKRLGCSGIDAV